MLKLRIGVLMGGKSIEREATFNSGRTICDHLDTNRFDIIPIFQTSDGTLYILPEHFLHRGKTSDFEHRLSTEAKLIKWDSLKTLIDFAYIALHGQFTEDGTIQGVLEVLGIPYLGSGILTSAVCMDKDIQKNFLQNFGINVSQGVSIDATCAQEPLKYADTIFAALHEKQLTFPLVVKPHKEGSSLGISVVHNQRDLLNAIYLACTIQQEKPQAVLVEEKLQGMEFSCVILKDYKNGSYIPLAPTEIIPDAGTEFFDYEQKYMPGRSTKFTPARCDTETIDRIQKTCIMVMDALEIETIGRIDGFVTTDNRIVIIDPNTIPGMAPTSFLFREAAEIGMTHTQIINYLIETELYAYGMLDDMMSIQNAEDKANNTQKMRVAVLLGGASNEKETSLDSGRNVTYKLSPRKYIPLPLFVSPSLELYPLTHAQLVRNSTKEILQSLDPSTKIAWSDLAQYADFVFNALHGGAGENGAIQGMLDMIGMPYNGSGILASALCMDKYKTNQFLKSKGFSVPQHLLIAKKEWEHDQATTLRTIQETILFPLIAKPHDDGCSVFVSKIDTAQELQQALQDLFSRDKTYAMIEEYISGMELTVGVIGNTIAKALPPSQAIASGGILSIEEKFLPGAGENQTPAPLPVEKLALVQRTMEQAYQAVGCKGYVRIDCFYQTAAQSPTKEERVIILEINTLPGLTPATCIFHQAAEIGLKPMEFIDEIIRLGIELHGSKKHERLHEKAGNTSIARDVAHNEIQS